MERRVSISLVVNWSRDPAHHIQSHLSVKNKQLFDVPL